MIDSHSTEMRSNALQAQWQEFIFVFDCGLKRCICVGGEMFLMA